MGQSGSIAASSPLQLNSNVSGSTAVSSVVNFLETVSPEFDVPFLLRFGHKAPFIPVKVENVTLPFLLDTGASVSVLPKDKVFSFLSDYILTYAADDYSPSRTITAFGGRSVTVEGPFRITIELLNLKFSHNFFLIIICYLIRRQYVKRPQRRCCYSFHCWFRSDCPNWVDN